MSLSKTIGTTNSNGSPPSYETLILGGETPVLAVWGGVGFTRRPVRDIRELYYLHKDDLSDFLEHCSGVLGSLTLEEGDRNMDNILVDFMSWITDHSKRAPAAPALSPAVNTAVTTVLQMARYVLMCKRLEVTPGELARSFTAFAGHSLGMIAAVGMAAADSWSSLYEFAEAIIMGTYWGARAASAVWSNGVSVSQSKATECIRHGEGAPSSMLSITGLERSKVIAEIDAVNLNLSPDRKIHLALTNDVDSFVAAGDTDGLVGLCARLRTPASGGNSKNAEARIILTDNRARCSLQFIPSSVPFHSPHLEKASSTIREKVQRFKLKVSQLLTPVWGLDELLNEDPSLMENLGPGLIDMTLSHPVDWPKTMKKMSGRWQVVDFGPGGFNGIGMVIQRMKAGSRSKVYVVSPADNWRQNNVEGAAHLLSLLSADPNPPRYFYAKFQMRQGACKDTTTPQTSRFTEVMGLPRVLVAGMTPTTCDVDFVAAIMNAGFYVELGTGAYHDAHSLATAVRKLARSIPEGRFITVNVVYANPRGIKWMIPQLASLVREGCPIGGLTIGAGVPAPEIAAEYIKALELSYIGFKPASVSAIHQVLDIAKSHSTLPVLLQWTGGRAGGHHSMEDFHQPILETYQAIREVNNVLLVGGSGFGDAEGSWPYISGEWSKRYGRPPMPFDAILLGTCIMTTLEAKTSLEAKKAMIDACGTTDTNWRATLDGPTGDIISIISHLGEPMHVVATRGMRLWAELDKTLFHKPKKQILEILHSRREYIIGRLNDDYQKVWFGFDYASNKPVELADMTYFDVLRRTLELLHPARYGDWTDPSYIRIFNSFLIRILERFAEPSQSIPSTLEPRDQLDSVALQVPDSMQHFISFEDAHFFVDICQQAGQKPVPFIPVLDRNFSTWFKKDPLWQSENLDLTYHGDAGRVCILSGPVAIQHCKEINVPVGTLLNRINQGYTDREANLETFQVPQYPSPMQDEENELTHAMSSHIIVSEDTIQYREDSPDTLNNDRWLLLLGSRLGTWGKRFFGMRKLISNGRAYENPIRRLFFARPRVLVRFLRKTEDGYSGVEVCGNGDQRHLTDARVSHDGTTITVTIINRLTIGAEHRELQLKFNYDPSKAYAPITEVMDGRNDRMSDFYHDALFGSNNIRSKEVKPHVMRHPTLVISRNNVLAWMRAVDGKGLESPNPLGPEGEVPIEYATVLMLSATWRHLFTWGWDVSRLLHQRTIVQMKDGHRMLSVGDEVIVTSRLRALRNRDSGIDVSIYITYERDGEEILGCIYRFMMLGQQVEDGECFERSETSTWTMNIRSDADIEALFLKRWFLPVISRDAICVGDVLRFEVQREALQGDSGLEVTTSGKAWLEEESDMSSVDNERILCANVEQELSIDHADPIENFLKRKAVRTGGPVPLPADKILRTKSGDSFKIATPDNSLEYAEAGGDYNPIHTNSTFARFSGFQTPVYHGNQTIALVLQLIRREIPGASVVTIRQYDCILPTVVFPGDLLNVSIKLVGMDNGCAILELAARRQESDELVLAGQVTLEAQPTAFLFTGQGSQFAGMGLDLIDQSRESRLAWASADEYFKCHWGFSISGIVKHNPKQLTVNFCGRQGMQVRQNYLGVQEMLRSCSTARHVELFKGLRAESRSYTFQSENGLLGMTQFAQPAIFVVEKAALEILKQLGRVPPGSYFAGHSLGEFAALGCMTSVMSMNAALKAVFLRGALMQAAVPQDHAGCSGYGMVAVDPSRISKECHEQHILLTVNEIAHHTGLLLEMVNFNVRGYQYVCAGDKRCLDILRRVTDELHNDQVKLNITGQVKQLVVKHSKGMESPSNGITLIRGKATVPLKGINVPFHSSLLAPMRQVFRQLLAECVEEERIVPEELIGKWIPNVTGKPFAVDSVYRQLVKDSVSAKAR